MTIEERPRAVALDLGPALLGDVAYRAEDRLAGVRSAGCVNR